MIKPYYEEPGITIYHGDCRDILPHLEQVDLVLTDPPYIGYKGYGWQEIDLRDLLPNVHSFIFWKGNNFSIYTERENR